MWDKFFYKNNSEICLKIVRILYFGSKGVFILPKNKSKPRNDFFADFVIR